MPFENSGVPPRRATRSFRSARLVASFRAATAITAAGAVILGSVGIGLAVDSGDAAEPGTAASPTAPQDVSAEQAALLLPAATVQSGEAPDAGDAVPPRAAAPLAGPVEDPEASVTTIVRVENGADDVPQRAAATVREVAAEQGRENDVVEVTQTYTHAFDGYAISVPRWAVGTVQGIDGVQLAFVEETYAAPQPEPGTALDAAGYTWQNGSSLAMTGADRSTRTGEGTIISVVDTGLDTQHEAFTGPIDPKTAALSAAGLDAARSRLGAGARARWVSEKVPFAYDYADGDDQVSPGPSAGDMSHGTHVAGIAAANGGPAIRGAAPGAQLMVQKVFDDLNGTTRDSILLAALDDAVELAPDVVNLSLGSDAGFSVDRDSLYADVYEALHERGTIVNAAAGNSDHAAVQNTSRADRPFVADPDYGVVSAPASYARSLAVASIDNSLPRPYLRAADGRHLHYVDTRPSGDAQVAPLSALPAGTYRYVDAGDGSAEAIASLTDGGAAARDTVLLIRRGGEDAGEPLTFQAKLDNAAAAAPAAVVFVDDRDDRSVVPEATSSPIPSGLVSRADGETLIGRTDARVDVDPRFVDLPDTAYRVSTFSSMGVTPELELKPDVAAPGGDIFSAVPGGTYAWESGTSMAAPHLAGVLAVVKEQLEDDPAYADRSAVELAELARRLVINTAEPVDDPEVPGTPVSPRKQGAGLANVPAALSSPVSLSVPDSIDGRPVASLGESASGLYSFEVVAANVSDEARTYRLSASALTDRMADGLFQDDPVDWAGAGVSVDFGGDARGGALTVPAGGTATVTVTVRADQPFVDAVAPAVNGLFLDGFVRFSADDAPELGIPYLAFFGDWSAAPVFDAPAATGDAHMFGSVLVNSGNGVPLGVNPLDEAAVAQSIADPKTADPERRVVAPTRFSASNNRVQMATGTLRNVEELDYELVRDADEAIVARHSYDKVRKALYDEGAGRVLYTEARLPHPPVFSAFSEDGVELASGSYTLRQRATTAGPGSAEQVVTTGLRYDNLAPRVDRARLSDDGTALEVSVSDDTWIASFDLQEYAGAGYFHRVLGTDPVSTDADGRHHYEISIPIEQARASWAESEGKIGTDRALPATAYLYVWDYGLNLAEPLPVTLFESPVTGMSLSAETLRLAPGQSAALTATLQPTNAAQTPIVWTVADPRVATIEDGRVRAVAAGETVVTATAGDTGFSAQATVTVAEVPEERGIELSPTELTVGEGATAIAQALRAPSLRDAELTWSSSDEDVATVSESAVAGEVVVTGVARGTTVVEVSADVPGGRSVRAAIDVTVVQPDHGDFVVENGVLRAYVGTRSVIDVPAGIREIGAEAFAGSTLSAVSLPASVERIGDSAFREMPGLVRVSITDTADEPSRLESIGDDAFNRSVRLSDLSIPASVREIGERSFSLTALTSIVLPAGVTTIPARAFEQAALLARIELRGDVTSIRENAFAQTSALQSIELPASLEEIGDAAFISSGLTSLTLPTATRRVGASAFAGAPLVTVDLGNVETIGLQAFSQTRLTEVVLPDSLRTVGRSAFAYIANLEQVTVGRRVEAGTLTGVFVAEGDAPANPRLTRFVVPDDAAAYSARDGILYDKAGAILVSYPAAALASETLVIPANTERIDDLALLGSAARRVELPEGLVSVGRGAFAASRIERLDAPASLRTLGDSAFARTSRLASIDLNQVETMGARAFAQATALTGVDLGDRLREIGDSAFESTTALTSFDVPDTVVRIGERAFLNSSNLTRLHLGASVEHIGQNAFTGIPGLRDLTVAETNRHYRTDESVLYGREDDGLHLKLYLPAKTDTEYTVVDGTVAIDAQAFRNNAAIERIVLPEGLRVLGTGAFNSASSLREVVAPDSLEVVDGFYFLPLRTLELGTKVRSFDSAWSMGTTLEHLVVRGGADGAFDDAFGGDGSPRTAYFGPGMTKISYTETVPAALVVPADLATLSLARAGTDPLFRVYAPENSPGWDVAAAALKDAGHDPVERLLPYVGLSVSLEATFGESAAENAVTARAAAAGGVTAVAGVAQPYEYRFSTVDAAGARTVVGDWSTEAQWSGSMSPDHALVAEARDATRLTAAADWTVREAPLVVASPVDVSVTAGSDAVFSATATGSPAPDVQWQERVGEGAWTDIAGATGASLTLSDTTVRQTGTRVRAVFTNTAGSATTAEATLTVTTREPSGPGEPGEPGAGEQPTAPPAIPELSADNRGSAVLSAQNGRTVTVNLGLDRADAWVGATLHSTPRFLGWVRADGSGTVVITVPDDVFGMHRLSFVDRDARMIGWIDAAFPVEPGANPGAGPGAVPGAGAGSGTGAGAGGPAAVGGGSDAGGTATGRSRADAADALAATGGAGGAGALLALAALCAALATAAGLTARRLSRRT